MLINNDTIIKDTDPLIREKSEPVSLPLSKEDETLLRDMLQYVKDSTDEEKAKKFNLRPAVGISAIQVGDDKTEGPNFDLVSRIVNELDCRCIAEGRIHEPSQARKMLELGAFAVVVGGAITRPLEIATRFIKEINKDR